MIYSKFFINQFKILLYNIAQYLCFLQILYINKKISSCNFNVFFKLSIIKNYHVNIIIKFFEAPEYMKLSYSSNRISIYTICLMK